MGQAMQEGGRREPATAADGAVLQRDEPVDAQQQQQQQQQEQRSPVYPTSSVQNGSG